MRFLHGRGTGGLMVNGGKKESQTQERVSTAVLLDPQGLLPLALSYLFLCCTMVVKACKGQYVCWQYYNDMLIAF